MLTVIADENIAHVHDYFNHVRLITLKGRDINQSVIDQYTPDALLIRSVTPVNEQTFHDLKNVKFIGSATIGTDHVDEAFLAKNDICFANAKGCSKHSVAQYVITAIFHVCPNALSNGVTLGIIGLGNIGSTLAKYAKDLNWDILGHDPYLPPSSINNTTFDDLLDGSDIISIHTPLTHTGNYPTHQLFNQSAFGKIKHNALLINTARGEIIYQDDLLQAIDDKNLQVILDVFPHEPNIDKALLDRLAIATPHIAGYTLEGKLRGTDMIYQNFCRYFGLPITQKLDDLLPPNPHTWHNIKTALQNQDTPTLQSHYDIQKDDDSLRQVCHADGVMGNDFDELRKNYHLKREWLFND
ncbi:4-phosphoerythronate dehydrogenase [Moraxella nasovis]|uniref:4-phosphoerythronate dehydrogenase n=1 Tax=Moraxella nasovis TaxID=2904121 RepID=UPI0035CD08CB